MVTTTTGFLSSPQYLDILLLYSHIDRTGELPTSQSVTKTLIVGRSGEIISVFPGASDHLPSNILEVPVVFISAAEAAGRSLGGAGYVGV